MKNLIDLVTTSRMDYSIVTPLAAAIGAYADLAPRVIFTGGHFRKGEEQRLANLQHTAPFATASVPCRGIGKDTVLSGHALAEMITGFSGLWTVETPALAVLLGDRFDLLAPAASAALFGVPIAHLFGGESDLSCGLDTQVRDAVTKMAHLHFVAHEALRERLLRMNEEAWRIHVSGNPAVDHPDDQRDAFLAFAREFGWATGRLLAACYLPPTAFPDRMLPELDSLLDALDDWPDHSIVWAGVNADPGAGEIEKRLRAHAAGHENHHYVEGLGPGGFRGLLQSAEAWVGNSASGLLETASFGLPAVSVGIRLAGRLCGGNVIHAAGEAGAIRDGLSRAIEDREFRKAAATAGSPFRTGDAALRIAGVIAESLAYPREKLMLKRSSESNPATEGGLQRITEV